MTIKLALMPRGVGYLKVIRAVGHKAGVTGVLRTTVQIDEFLGIVDVAVDLCAVRNGCVDRTVDVISRDRIAESQSTEQPHSPCANGSLDPCVQVIHCLPPLRIRRPSLVLYRALVHHEIAVESCCVEQE